MILRVINDFSFCFFFSLFIYLIYGPGLKMLIIWLLFDSAMLKCSFYYYDIIIIFTFPHAGAYLSLNCCLKEKKITKQKWKKKKKNVWYSKDFYLCFLLLDTFPVVLAITSPSMIILFGFFLSEPSHLVFVFVFVCFFNFKNNEFCYFLLVYRCSAVMHT